MLALDVNGDTLAAQHQNGNVLLKPDPGPVSAGALSGASAMESLKVEIVDVDGVVVQVIEIPDPRVAYVLEWNARYGDSSQARAA